MNVFHISTPCFEEINFSNISHTRCAWIFLAVSQLRVSRLKLCTRFSCFACMLQALVRYQNYWNSIDWLQNQGKFYARALELLSRELNPDSGSDAWPRFVLLLTSVIAKGFAMKGKRLMHVPYRKYHQLRFVVRGTVWLVRRRLSLLALTLKFLRNVDSSRCQTVQRLLKLDV